MSTPKFGTFPAKVDEVILDESNANFRLRLVIDDKTSVSHRIQLDSFDSVRIGTDELRRAFPEQLLDKATPAQVLETFLTETDKFIGQQATVAIEPQLDRSTGIVRKNEQGQPYYNVRLRSAMRNLKPELAKSVVTRALANAKAKSDMDDAFGS